MSLGMSWGLPGARYVCEYAKSARSSCKEFRCKQKIDKSELRVGIEVDEDDHYGIQMGWYHPACLAKTFTYKKGANKTIHDPSTDVTGFSALKKADQDALVAAFSGGVVTPAAKSKKNKADSDADEEKKPAKKAKTAGKKDTHPLQPGGSQTVDDYEVTRLHSGYYSCDCQGFKFKKGKLGTKVCKHIESIGVTAALNKAGAIAAAPKSTAKQKKVATISKDKKEEVQAMSGQQLKNLLKANDQLVGGTKNELVKRVVDCIEYGCLPRCPICSGGKMKKDGGGFKCPGYMDDDTFQYCGYSATADQLTFPKFVFDA